MEKILVSSISFEKAKSTFEEINSSQNDFIFEATNEEEGVLAKEIKSKKIRGFIADVYPYNGALYEALGHGSVISRYGVGHDSIDKEKAKAAGVTVCNTPGVLDNAVAEHACWMIASLARILGPNFQSTMRGEWNPLAGVEIAGRSIAILGCGRIGQRLARKLGLGLEMKVTAMDVMPDFLFGADSGIEKYTTNIEEAVSNVDFVITLLPVLEATKNIINADLISQMRKGTYFINSARGALVDEEALYDALKSGHLAGAGLDVFQQEPYAPVSPEKDLRDLDNVFLTPHIGSNTAESNRAMASTAAKNIMEFLQTGTCANIVK